MSDARFRVGVVFPQIDLAADREAAARFAQEVEKRGFSHIVLYDHILGADTSVRPDWKGPYDINSAFLEPLLLFSHWAATTSSIGLMTGILIGPQRQTALLAKQAATLDFLSGGRLRLGLGVGWNEVEYDALGIPFNRRGKILDEQIPLLRRLWTEESLTDRGDYHNIVAAGIRPLPVQRPIPIWVGGTSEPAMRRVAKKGDGWLPLIRIDKAEAMLAEFRAIVANEGRDPATVPVENILFFSLSPERPAKTVDAVVAEAERWKELGAAGVAIDTMRIGLTTLDSHLALLEEIANKLQL